MLVDESTNILMVDSDSIGILTGGLIRTLFGGTLIIRFLRGLPGRRLVACSGTSITGILFYFFRGRLKRRRISIINKLNDSINK